MAGKDSLASEIEQFTKEIEEMESRPTGARIRASVPPADYETLLEEEEERFTADVREEAKAAVEISDGTVPLELFEAVRSALGEGFASELEAGADFLRIKYFVPSPEHLVETFGSFSPLFNESFANTRWEDLFKAVWRSSARLEGTRRPQGIHFVHQPGEDDRPRFSLDVTLDGRSAISKKTTEVELAMSLALYHADRDGAALDLGHASRAVQAYGKAIERVAEAMGHPVTSDSALVQLFFMLDASRFSNLEEHAVDLDQIGEGHTIYELNAQASFRGRDLKVVLSDTSGLLYTRARDLHESSERHRLPLVHFSLGLRRKLNTVTLTRRFST